MATAVGIHPVLEPVVTLVTTGTAVPFNAAKIAVQSMIIQASPGNAGPVYIGDATVTAADGISLVAGEKIGIDSIRRNSSFDSFYLNEWFLNGTGGDSIRILILDYRH
jgi:hypothetical protein